MSSIERETRSTSPRAEEEDDPMQGQSGDEEGEGDAVMADDNDDSSEEGDEEDPEEFRKVAEGFIVDEDEEEEEEEEEAPRKHRKKRRKRQQETLEDDDLDLLEENTGGAFKRKNRLTRLRHRHDSESPPAASSSRRHQVIESSDDDLDNGDIPEVADIGKIWDDGRDVEDDEDMSDFIDDSDEEEGGVAMNEEAREARRQEKRQEQIRRKRARVRPELAGIDANAWDELHDAFGDGHEYDWALAGEDDMDYEEDIVKPDMRYQDVFEPSEIRKRLLTEDDDLIRGQDIPERMQLAVSSLTESSTLSVHNPLTQEDIGGAAMWVTQRISDKKNAEFFTPTGQYQHLKGSLVLAVTFALQELFIEEYEVPYIWAHKQDLLRHFNVDDIGNNTELLNRDDLWRINTLGKKYRSLLERRRALSGLYERLQVKDEYYEEEIFAQLESVEVIADTTEWLSMKYKDKKQDPTNEFRFHDDEEVAETKKRKNPSRISDYDVVKKSLVSKLAEKFGIAAHQVVLNFLAGYHAHFVNDPELNPLVYAEQFVDPNAKKPISSEEALKRARMIIATELGKDPLLRNQIRKLFKEEARITVTPTERGVVKIDESHPYFNFKYLKDKPVSLMIGSAQFLHVLKAESEHLVTVDVFLPAEVRATFERKLVDAISSDNFTESATAWNNERSRVVVEVMEAHLMPAGIKWTREYIRDEAEDSLARRCSEALRSRANTRPYSNRKPEDGGDLTSSVLAISWGKGDPHKDAITMLYIDEAGRMRETTKIDNLHDPDNKDEFIDFVQRRKPDVAVIGGFSIATMKLYALVREIFHGRSQLDPDGGWSGANDEALNIPVVYVHDDIARIYQHSKRAAEEFSALSPTAKYCVGLARYAQNPLNEFAALGSDIAAISFDEGDQTLIPKDKLLTALEQVLVDVTNEVGVDINRAVTDPYYQHLLPFVCGLGPRKAQVLVKKIVAQGGTLINRDQFIKAGLLTTKIFLNASGFLRVIQDRDMKAGKYRPDDENAPDPLDDTRIHPEDYELARKMATDALELDEEDIHDEHPSQVVSAIISEPLPDRERKLQELNLDEFAISLYQANSDQKRHTLNVIRDELTHPFMEKRGPFKLPTDWEVLTMLSGETSRTLNIGLIVSALVYRIQRDVINVRLASGIEGVIQVSTLGETVRNPQDLFKKGQAVTAVVVECHFKLVDGDECRVDLSCSQTDLAAGDVVFRNLSKDKDFWDEAQYEKDRDILLRKKRAESNRTRRVIKHPNFHNFNTAQAEAYLEKQQPGDVVIRPSSKGANHLAVTWKVADKLYQHIDVTELNADPSGQTVGGQLIVDATHTYSDLDELIVNHVQAMARRVEELMAHEKFKSGSEDELHLFLKNFLAANPAKSMYGFTLNRKRPGHFSLCFLANKNSIVQTWPVRVAPEAFYLFDAAAVGVSELCDAFKVRHLHETQNMAVSGGKTPYGAGLGRTPARTGGATPGHMSIRQPNRTPNPYGGGQTPYNSQMPPPFVPPPPPHAGYNGYHGQTPSHRPQYPNQPPPPPMNQPRPPVGYPQARSGWP